ncbi:ylmG-like protein 1-2, chloroplastic-like [Heracleum sosnowskyi]|uniref:YlmG-like protein 1-2, chloroplastic-like n=1 Tax=Heracleum sosnowskyi TaxID=360622 RepID=A0AAD8HPZ4_9APIA|nr:ylmG-like protein 1-2, chloroplastic-like [Heracleum sosnowskyi]
MAAQTLILLNPTFESSRRYNPTSQSLHSLYPKHIHTSPVSKPTSPISRKSKIFASNSNTQNPTQSQLTESTRTVTSLLALTLSVSRLFSEKIGTFLKGICAIPSQDELLGIKNVQESLVCSIGPLFFAGINTGPRALNTPLTVVAAGMSKWLEIYSAVLMVRVLLSWFPNIPWDRQPLSAIRDLCDPYLNLFRNIIPPLFDTLDVSPLLAFAVLGSLSGILGATTRPY